MTALFNFPVKRILVIALVAISSCKDPDKNSSLIFEELNESLERSNKIINISSKGILMSLREKIVEPETTEKATIWFPVADSVYSRSKELVDFIDALRSNLKQNKIDIGPNTSNNLYKKLKSFKEFVSTGIYYLQSEHQIDSNFLVRDLCNEAGFYETNFLNNDAPKITAQLLKLESNIIVTTNDLMIFCDRKTAIFCGLGIKKFQPIAVANTTKLGIGEELIINVGIGEFNLTGRPSYEIDGIKIQPNINGVGEYKTKIKKRPGNYKAHVKIRYTSPDGKEDVLEKDIEYTVVK